MLKLMKYEFIKQKTSKLVLAGLLGIGELAFIIGVINKNDTILGLSAVALMMIVYAAFIVVGLEAITTYYKDMKEKRGYMLFMTPHSVYTILGSKILTSILTMVITILLFGFLAFADILFMAARYGELANILEQITTVLSQILSFDISWGMFAIVLTTIVFAWIGMLTSAFLAITLCMTLLSGVKAKGFISFILYIVINFAFDFAVVKFENALNFVSDYAELGVLCGTTCIFAIICFVFSGYMLNKELSL